MRLRLSCLPRTATLRHAVLLLCALLPTACAVAQAPSQPSATTKPAERADGMEFTDKPSYSVAGVTDWTAVGGHGSDATLRTSEELNREAVALRARAAAESVAGKVPAGGANLDADGHRLAGDRAEKEGRPLVAVQEYQRAAELSPTEANYLAWGTELLLHRAVWQATEVLLRASRAVPDSAPVKTALGAALFAGARYGEASQQLCLASSLAPTAREPYLFAGKVAAAAPATDACIGTMLQRFQAEHPDDAQANYLLATALRKQRGQDARVEQLLKKTVALDPQCSDAFVQLGVLAAAHNNATAAVANYQQALRADPRNSEAHFRLGTAYDRAGDHGKAAAEYALHRELDAANAAAVEKERREVQQFSAPEAAAAQPNQPAPK